MNAILLAAWRYRHFIVSSIRNEFVSRFSRSRMGSLWMIIHPLSQVLIFALILSEVLAAKLPGIENKYSFALYLMAGLLAWTPFSEIVTRCLTLFIDQGNLMKKMAFPRICLPLIASGAVLLNNALLFVAMLIIFAMLGHIPGVMIFWLPMLVLITMAFGTGIGLILGIFNVFIRDVGQVIPVVLQALFWLTPIAYSEQILPETYRGWFALNPLHPLVTSYQNVLVFNQPPRWESLAGIALTSGIALVFALFMFRKASAELVDVL